MTAILGAELLVWCVALLIACLLMLAFWAIVAGDKEGDMVEEDPPKLNTRGKD